MATTITTTTSILDQSKKDSDESLGMIVEPVREQDNDQSSSSDHSSSCALLVKLNDKLNESELVRNTTTVQRRVSVLEACGMLEELLDADENSSRGTEPSSGFFSFSQDGSDDDAIKKKEKAAAAGAGASPLVVKRVKEERPSLRMMGDSERMLEVIIACNILEEDDLDTMEGTEQKSSDDQMKKQKKGKDAKVDSKISSVRRSVPASLKETAGKDQRKQVPVPDALATEVPKAAVGVADAAGHLSHNDWSQKDGTHQDKVCCDQAKKEGEEVQQKDDPASPGPKDDAPSPQGSSPGAFAIVGIGTPLENQQVEEDGVAGGTPQPQPERLQSPPGAFAVAPRFGGDVENQVQQEEEGTGELAASLALTHGLSVAQPVVEPSLDELPAAEELDLSDVHRHRRRRSQKHRQSHCKALALQIGAAVVIITVVVLCLVVFIARGDDPSEVVSSSPTASPSPSPTSLSPGEYVMSLLPNYTIAKIKKHRYSQQSAFDWLINDPSLANYSDTRILQRMALATFYFSTGGDQWIVNDNWLSYDHHECEWYTMENHSFYEYPETYTDRLYNETGGLCGNDTSWEEQENESDRFGASSTRQGQEEGKVQHLWLHSNGLQGTIPGELALLSSLRSISIDRNKIEGRLTSRIGQLQDLEALGLFSNDLSDSLPTELGLLSNLSFLWLMQNKLEGSLPTELGQLSSKLRYLLLDNNQLTGPIPSEVGLLPNVIYFWLYSNQMSGTLPTELGSIKALNSFAVDVNPFVGPIPSEMGQLEDLYTLHVADSLMTGSIPSELGLAQNIHKLGFQNTYMNGTLPSELGLLTNLFKFWSWDTNFWGTIPTEFGNMAAMESLSIDANSLSGPLPSELGLLHKATLLHLPENKLTGTIPTQLGGLRALTDNILLFSNQLSGPIPSELGLLRNLSKLELHNNNLSGQVPSELGLMLELRTLSLQNNSLVSGSIPSSLCNLSTWLDGDGISVDCELVECTCGNCTCDRR